MKNQLLLAACLCFAACATPDKTIRVINPGSFARSGELVEVEMSQLAPVAGKSYILKNPQGEEVPYQLTAGGTRLLFPVNAESHATVTYTFTPGTPAEVTPRTFARHIPERKDDFAWENDLAAYRMYGPALAPENPSNGVDLWLKKTDRLIVDKFYHEELVNKRSYHIDHGEGLDCYKVGHTLGAGGIAPYTTQLWVGDHYSRWEMVEQGPLRTTFTLTYDSVRVADLTFTQSITITVDAGSPLNKAVVRYEGPRYPMQLAAGIFLHDRKGIELTQPEKGIIAYAEPAVSDFGVPAGRNYVGVYIPEGTPDAVNDGTHLLLLSPYTAGETFTYYFGGGWSQWKFETDESWFKALELFKQARELPLTVEVH